MRSKLILFTLVLLSFKSTFAQTIVLENMGNPSSTTTITNNIFQNSTSLTYANGSQTNAADVRATSASAGYSGASGGGNVFFTATSGAYGFSIEGINASNYNSLTLQFGYRKEAASSLPSLIVDYWDGNSWVTIANTSATLFNELPSATASWYLSKSLSLPVGAQINGLKLRFVKSGTVAIRIDDVKLTGIETLPAVSNATVTTITTNSAIFGGNVTSTGGSTILATGSVYSITSVNANPTLGGSGVTTLSTISPNSGTGTFSNNSGTVLSPNVNYSYKAYATKTSGATGYGIVNTFYTLATIPTAPIVTNIRASKLDIAIGNDSNSSITTYAIQEVTSGNYVQNNGVLGATPVFQTKSLWATKTVSGLTSSTNYSFQVIAKNNDGIITSNGTLLSVTTLQDASITASGTLASLSTTYGTASAFTSFVLNGTNLTDAVVITPPNGFEVSMTSGGTSGYSNSLILNPTNGLISSTTIYVRLAATIGFGTYSGVISLTSANDEVTTTISTMTSTVSKLNVTISGVTANNKTYDGTTIATLQGTPIVSGILTNDSSTATLNISGVSANFEDALIGGSKNVIVTGYSLNGTASTNYLVVQPTGLSADITSNSSSDIIYNTTTNTNTNANIDYKSYTGTTLTSTGTGVNGSIGVFGFYVRDGGSGLNDVDNLGTELTDITFSITNPAAIKSARLFVGTSARGVAVPVNGASSVTFSGLTNIVASDNSQLAVHLRVTFNSTVTDNQQFQFAVTSVTAKATGSTFAAVNVGGVVSSIANNVNKIEVVADRLSFVQQPSTTYVSNDMVPAPSVIAKDVNGNIDLDFSEQVTITSTGNLTPLYNAITSNGLTVLNAIKHTDAGTGLVLTASATGLIAATSNSFDTIDLIIPTFTPVASICYGSTPSSLPIISNNGITGSWMPTIVDSTATTTYTFTPNAGQNAVSTTLIVTVDPLITPIFTAVPPVPYGTVLSPLPTTSNNSITGTWSQPIDNSVTTVYTFTPSVGACATTTTLSIVVIPPASTLTLPINSIRKISYKTATANSSTSYAASEVVEQVVYFDGLGRAIQQKAVKQSNSGKDIVTPIEYDIFGRQPKEYLPYVNAATNLNYEPNALADQAVFYANQGGNFESNAYPYSQKIYDGSPLNRVVKVSAPGDDWRTTTTGADRTTKIAYQLNIANEVHLFTVTTDLTTYATTLVDGGTYAANELYKTISKNENWEATQANAHDNTVEEFKDKEGRVVMKRTYGTSTINTTDTYETHDTYYVYDQFSNLVYVIPPKVNINATISDDILKDLCYQYKYDYRNRLVEKKVPGKLWEYIVYDKLNRVVATGPAQSPFNDATSTSNAGWMITKYDVFNRTVTTGWMSATTIDSTERSNLQTTIAAATQFNETKSTTTYTNVAWPTSGYEPLTVNYYDDYNTTLSFSQAMSFLTDGYDNTTALPKGLPTQSWVRVPEGSSSSVKEEKTYIIYDKKARPVTSFSNNHLGGYTKVTSQMELITGRVNQTITTHRRSMATTDAEVIITDTFSYTAQDRLVTHKHQIGNGVEQLLSKNEYSELGQLISKRVGSKTLGDFTDGLQKIDYSYNDRGWLKTINDVENLGQDLFAYKLNYNTVDNPNTIKQYNGTIAEVVWRVASDDVKKQYSYSYDELNRMKTAVFSKPISGATAPIDNAFGENAGYDKNGNITHLERYTDGTSPTNQIDDLAYNYQANSNKLMSVTDLQTNNPGGFIDGNTMGDDYTYDDYGNLIIDKNKNITDPTDVTKAAIVYNHLNLPIKITFGSAGTIEYLYDALGKRLQKKVTQPGAVTTTEYLDGFQYENNVLLFFATSEGYVKADGTYVFQYKDHLGNIRVSYYNNNGTATIVEEHNYYPFGLKHDDNNYLPTDNKYKYNGKEYQDELGLNLTAMDFRQYDNTLGRFNVIDPLAEQDYGITPYHFGYDNPVLFGDPSGLKAMAPESIENSMVPGSILAMFASGMNGLQVRDALEQQAWGPNFMIIHAGGGGGSSGGNGVGGDRYDGAGGVHLLTTNYQTGQSGYWDRRYVGNENTPFEDTSITINGITYLPDCVISPIYQKVWMATISNDWGWKNIQSLFNKIDNWIDKHEYAEGVAVLKVGTYVDVGIKHVGRLSLGEYREKGYLLTSNSLNQIDNTKFVAGAAVDAGGQYTYDEKTKENNFSFGWDIFSYERTGDRKFLGININLSLGIGIGGEVGVKYGFQW